MRYMGLDFGEKTIGVAVSDPRNKIALGVGTVRREIPSSMKRSIGKLSEIIKAYGVDVIVLGYPKNMDNSVSARCAATEEFKARLERNFKNVSVILWDERLSTAAVSRGYEGGGIEYGRRVDEMAAVYILQGYLDYKNSNAEVKMEEDLQKITMYDDEGSEMDYTVLSAREKNGVTYMLVEEVIPEDDEEEFADVLIFKCAGIENDEMVCELVDDEHGEFEDMLDLFKDDFEELEIEINDEEEE